MANPERDADAALAKSGERFVEDMKEVARTKKRTERVRLLLQQNHFAETFYNELKGRQWRASS